MSEEKYQVKLDRLPTEILYQILDLLHCETILTSFANVSRRFREIAKTYNRYRIDLRSISKSNFHIICRMIQPENVKSLTLSDDDKTPGQIGLFLSSFDINKFKQLRHLTLINIAAIDLKKISHRFKLNLLRSFTMETRGNHVLLPVKMIKYIVEQPHLNKLRLKSLGCVFDRISWPLDCSLQCLKIETCTQAQFLTLLNRLPNLKALDMILYSIDSTVAKASVIHRSLINLTINIVGISLTTLEPLFQLTPSLVHLKIVSSNCHSDIISNSFLWETMIQVTLPELERFEFFFTVHHQRQDLRFNAETVIEPFRQPFWLEYKHWLVCCEQTGTRKLKTHLYTIPICKDHWKYQEPIEKVFSTVDHASHNITNRVSRLTIDLTEPPFQSMLTQVNSLNSSMRFEYWV